jgi:hypothetical protein
MGLVLKIRRINMSAAITAAVIGGAAVLGGAAMASSASRGAARTQADASNRAIEQQAAGLERQVALSEPYRTTGTAAMNRLAAMTEPGGEFYAPFSQTDFTQDPGYAFRLKEGMNAMNATAAARGGLISGNALRAGQAYGQQMGSQEYGNAFNRYYTERANRMEPLRFLSAQGQAAAAGQAANIGATTGNISNLTTGAGNAMAAGQIGSANAYTNAIGQGVNAYQMNQLINRSSYGRPNTVSFYGGERAGGAAPIVDYSSAYIGGPQLLAGGD